MSKSLQINVENFLMNKLSIYICTKFCLTGIIPGLDVVSARGSRPSFLVLVQKGPSSGAIYYEGFCPI